MSTIDYKWTMDDDNRLDGWYTDFVPGFKHYASNHMQTKGRDSAREMFEWLGGDCGKRDNPVAPQWDKQPESLQDVFRKKAQPGTQHYHFGLNQVFCVRGDLTTFFYTPAHGRFSMDHIALKRNPVGVSEGTKDLRRIEALEGEMLTISQRFEGKDEQRGERRRLKLEIYKIWRRISPKEVAKAILLELYESHVDKGEEVHLPDWMREKVEAESRRAAIDAELKEWKATLTPDQIALYDKVCKNDFKNFEEQEACKNDPNLPRFVSKIKADNPPTQV